MELPLTPASEPAASEPAASANSDAVASMRLLLSLLEAGYGKGVCPIIFHRIMPLSDE